MSRLRVPPHCPLKAPCSRFHCPLPLALPLHSCLRVRSHIVSWTPSSLHIGWFHPWHRPLKACTLTRFPIGSLPPLSSPPLRHQRAALHWLFAISACIPTTYVRNPGISYFSGLSVSCLLPPSPIAIPFSLRPDAKPAHISPLVVLLLLSSSQTPCHPHSGLPIDSPIIPPPTPSPLEHPYWLHASPALESPPTSSMRCSPLAVCYTCLHLSPPTPPVSQTFPCGPSHWLPAPPGPVPTGPRRRCRRCRRRRRRRRYGAHGPCGAPAAASCARLAGRGRAPHLC